jgi:hypothetical protein
MSTKQWSKDDNRFYPVETESLQKKLDVGVYTIQTPPMQPAYMLKIKQDFHFAYKVYGHQAGLIDRTATAWKHTTGNLGVLLNGVKGTGKSVTAEMICNRMAKDYNMPVVLITEDINGLSEFLSGIHQDIVVFVDEFEKVFSRDVDDYTVDSSKNILTIMDGALKSEHRRMFVFTTNNKYINENLLQRPGRLRYVVEFNDLKRDAIEEIVDDMLLWPDHREGVIEFISGLTMITVDIVKAVVQEVNMFNEDPNNFKEIFNVKEKGVAFNIYKGDVTDATILPKPIYSAVDIRPHQIITNPAARRNWKGQDFHIEDNWMGNILEVEDSVIKYEDRNGKKQTITIEETKAYHNAYAF